MAQKILAIEDEDDILDNIRIFLESENYEIITANNGLEGIRLAKENNPDLILCDIMMPGMDGYGVLNEVLNDDNLKYIPFIFLTAKVDKKDLRKGMEMGADDYIYKPFTCSELISAIQTRLSKFEKLLGNVSFDKTDSTKTEEPDKVDIDGCVFIKYHFRTVPVKINRIKYIHAENQYSKLVCEENKSYLIRKSLDSWNKILPEQKFIRIHRSNLINEDFIEKVEKCETGKYKIFLTKTDSAFEISRKYFKSFKSRYVFL